MSTVNSIDSKSYSFSLKILIGICDKWVEALVDTGSTVSLIEEDIVTGNVVKINDYISLKTAGKGDGLISNSKVKQQFIMGNKIFEHDFLVVKALHLSPISLILGYDLISKFKFIIKAQENTQILIDDLVIPTIASNSYTVNIIASERERQTFLINSTEIQYTPQLSLLRKLEASWQGNAKWHQSGCHTNSRVFRSIELRYFG